MVYGIIIQNILPDAAEDEYKLLGLMITSEDFNFKNNTHDISCKMRWIPDNLLIKEVITSLKNNISSANEEDTLVMKKIISYYRCINLNGLSPEEIDNIDIGAENSDWPETNLTKTEKINQKFGQMKERYQEIEEEHPKKMMAAKGIGTTGAVVGAVALGLTLSGVALSGIFGGKTSKKNMKVNKRNKKRTTRNYKKQNKLKKTRKRVKKARKIRKTKKQRNK
jgi:hypothetical protein